jgi:eukaryotic-like serine/threonine-protein kinase
MQDRIWEIASNGSNLHQVIPGWRPLSERCCGRWTPDGRFYVFLSEAQIWALDERRGLFRRPPAEPIQLTQGPLRWGEPFAASPGPRLFRGGPIPSKDGSKIFALAVTPRGELYRFDSKTKRFQPFLGGISALGVVFSNDGKSIAYVSYPEGILWKANPDGSNPVQLTDPPIQVLEPRWSPDDTQIVFEDLSSYSSLTRTTGYIVSSEGGSPRKIIGEEAGAYIDSLNWSPDGHKIVFNSQTTTGKNTGIRMLDLDSRQLTTFPGSDDMENPRWSPDGRYLATETPDRQLKIFDFKTQQWSELALHEELLGSREWSRDSQFIYFRGTKGDPGVFRIRVNGSAEERIADLKDWRDAGWWESSMALDLTDAPLLLRDIASDDIYALTLEQK